MNEELKTPQDLVRQLRAEGNLQAAELVEKQLKLVNPYEFSEAKKALDSYLTKDEYSIKLKKRIRTLAIQQFTGCCLIEGETGTGKELLAKALHGASVGKFVAVNCTALPSELVESILFGHVRGAFTGAVQAKAGQFSHAKNGTIFLDEIGDLPGPAQGKLLRAIQERKASQVGSNDEYEIVCKVVSATNRDLFQLVQEKKFREDLYYRLSTFTFKTKPLRERKEDIELIVENLLGKKTEHIEKIKELELKGNVRELINIVERIKVFNEL